MALAICPAFDSGSATKRMTCVAIWGIEGTSSIETVSSMLISAMKSDLSKTHPPRKIAVISLIGYPHHKREFGSYLLPSSSFSSSFSF